MSRTSHGGGGLHSVSFCLVFSSPSVPSSVEVSVSPKQGENSRSLWTGRWMGLGDRLLRMGKCIRCLGSV